MVELSIIIPYYRKERIVEKDARGKLAFLDSLHVSYEVIAVVDGAVDATQTILQRIGHDKLKIIAYERNRGKGYAVRKGFDLADGRFIGYIDGDLDIDVSVISRMYEKITRAKADIVYPNKFHRESLSDVYPMRRLISFLYRICVRILFHIDIKDTQTGAKLYRREAIKAILPHLRIDGFAFELEMCVMSARLGYRKFQEVPVSIRRHSGSSIRYGTALGVLMDTGGIFLRNALGRIFHDEIP